MSDRLGVCCCNSSRAETSINQYFTIISKGVKIHSYCWTVLSKCVLWSSGRNSLTKNSQFTLNPIWNPMIFVAWYDLFANFARTQRNVTADRSWDKQCTWLVQGSLHQKVQKLLAHQSSQSSNVLPINQEKYTFNFCKVVSSKVSYDVYSRLFSITSVAFNLLELMSIIESITFEHPDVLLIYYIGDINLYSV